MSTSRLIILLGPSIFHKIHPTPRFLSTIPPFRPIKTFPSPSLRFPRCCSSSAAVLEDGANNYNPESPPNPTSHPWPEWVAFVDRLKAKGYISESATGAEEKEEEDAETGGGSGDGVFYTDMNLLKDACLNFARDRYDLITSLSRQEMQTLVGKRCPNLLRKAVNSAKRLRAYLGLNERDVCEACILSGSCDRANLTLKESEGAARTVDVVRLLLLYALDPVVTHQGFKYDHREFVEVPARNLLSELTELSKTIPPPDLPEPSVKVTREKKKSFSFVRNDITQDIEMKKGDWICSKCNFMNFSRNVKCRQCGEDRPTTINANNAEMRKGDWICSECNFMNFSRNVKCRQCGEDGPSTINAGNAEMKEGDWICSECNFMNFSRNVKCRQCGEDGPSTTNAGKAEMKEGDWICSECSFMNFARNIRCLKCRAKAPKRVPADEIEMKKGDWNCLQCGFMNFASNIRCLRCRNERPKRELMKPGDWECPSCRFFNFRVNITCKKCHHERPEEVETQYDDMTWKKPFQGT